MFRQEEVFFGDWREKTIESMHKRRFELMVSQLSPLGAERLNQLSGAALERKLTSCWQSIPRKPMRALQETEIWNRVLHAVNQQADSLSHDEHELVERMLILGGCAQISDTAELEAARALSLRLWCHTGLISGKPYVQIEEPVVHAVAQAFAREEHEIVRRRFEDFRTYMTAALYRAGAMDDRQPQMLIRKEILHECADDELACQLARCHLWASYDCVDYSGGVLLVHGALADPRGIVPWIRRNKLSLPPFGYTEEAVVDILPEEIPLQQGLEQVIGGAMKNGMDAHDIARTIRFLCKQGAPLSELESVLQSALIVYVTPAMRRALSDMYLMIPKWVENSQSAACQ